MNMEYSSGNKIKELSPKEAEHVALLEVVENRVRAAVAKDPNVNPDLVRENFMNLLKIGSSVPNMERQSHLDYKGKAEESVARLLKEWKMLRMSKINKSDAEQEEIDKKMQILEEDIAHNKTASQERETLANG